MERSEKKGRKGLMSKTWERCCSMRRDMSSHDLARTPKAKSWPRRQAAPEGCFSVYVGAEKEKFVIRTQCLSHPMFKTLLDEAETEYGYSTDGPLELPCDVGHFERVMAEMESYDDGREGCHCGGGYGSYQLLSPARPGIVYRFG